MQITFPTHPPPSSPPVSPSGSPMMSSPPETGPPTPPCIPTSAPPPDLISFSPSPQAPAGASLSPFLLNDTTSDHPPMLRINPPPTSSGRLPIPTHSATYLSYFLIA